MIGLVMWGIVSSAAFAEIKLFEADTVQTMGVNDTREIARKIAVLEALRKAAEQTDAYVSDLPQVKDYRLSKEEVSAYTAGVLETEIVQEEFRETGERPSLYVKMRSRIDTDLLLKQIEQFRDNEELKEQLIASRRESELLRKKRDALLIRLDKASDERSIENIRKKLDSVLAGEETDLEVLKIWSQYARTMDFCDPSKHTGGPSNGELDRTVAVLEHALTVDQKNFRASFLLTSLYELKGELNAAEKQLKAAIFSNPTTPLFRMKLGLFLERQSRHEEALKEFLAVERLRPREPLVLFHIGMTYKNMDQCRQSVVNLKRFLKATDNRTSPRVTAMKKDAAETVKKCEEKPRGPGSRQSPIRKIK